MPWKAPWGSSGTLLAANFALLARSWALKGALVTLLERSWDVLGTSWRALGRSGALLAALGRFWDALGTLVARFQHLQGSILGSPRNPPGHFKEDSEQPKRTNANIPKVDRKLSENRPRRFRKPNPAALYSLLPTRSISKKLGAGGLRAAN